MRVLKSATTEAKTMNRTKITTLLTLSLALLSACARAHNPAGAATSAPAPSPSISYQPSLDPGAEQKGYLHSTDFRAIFIQWTKANQTINGQMQYFNVWERERPARTTHATYLLDGTNDGKSVVITIKKQDSLENLTLVGGRRLTGTISGDDLSLVWPATDGSLLTMAFRPASVADYNQAVAGFRQRAEQINAAYAAQQAEASRRQDEANKMAAEQRAVAEAHRRMIAAAAELRAAVKDATDNITYADIMKRYDQIWRQMQAESKAIKEKAATRLTDYQHTQLEYALTSLEYRITDMEYARTSLDYRLDSVRQKIEAMEAASKDLAASWQRLQQAVAANSSGIPKSEVTAEQVAKAVDLARAEIDKTMTARDAAKKQSATYHKWADDLYRQAKQTVISAKPANR